MAEMSDFLEDELLDHVFRNLAYASPASVHLSLHTADPTDSDAGTELPVANGYARLAITFGAPAGGIISNTGALTFTASGGDWGTITHAGIYDAAAAGNLLMHTPLDQSEVVNDGGSLTFAIGDVDVQFD